ncbi:MAG TPA: PQQ-binding-like beta-propeller repeat protein [Pyrinomonadaceae bacterium]|nr:PQQ-binding-like beta-propeller repeat protein [Pyrinomonadaceae bacterium]
MFEGRLKPSFSSITFALGVFLLASACSKSKNEAQYAEVEQHRAQQQQAAQAQASQSPSPTASQPGATPQASPGATQSTPQAAHVARNYWTNFRGPNRDGHYDEMPVLTNWPSQGLELLWKEPVGVGYASITIADDRAYTIEQRRRQEVVAAYDVNTGRELWTQSWSAEYTDETGDGPRTTPTWDDGWLYALGATGELRCLNAKTGAVRWGKNILSDNDAGNLPWAMAASPLIVDDKVIVLPGGTNGKSVVAYNKATGAPVWKVQNDRQAYVSPMLVTLGGRRQILVVSSSRVFGLAPENGALLWSQSWDTDSGINVSQPLIVDSNRFFISSGYGKGAALMEVTSSGGSLQAKTIWTNINMKNKFNSSVLHDGYVYGLDEGILTCLDVNTGTRKWKGGRYGYGQVLLASGHLIIMSDSGELALVKANPNEYTEVARFAALNGKTWNYPALAGGKLFVRNDKQMAVYKIAGT